MLKSEPELSLERVEQHVVRRTWGRIRDLQIEAQDGRIIVRGFTYSYYVKQLAIQALLEALDTTYWSPVVEIEVLGYHPSPPHAAGWTEGPHHLNQLRLRKTASH